MGLAKRFDIATRTQRTICAGFAAALLTVGLSGCMGGTTYGTGVSQEEQTLKDVYSMFNLKSERKNIDYTPRADLVVPQNTQELPEPIDSAATTSSPDWPETPDERIARIRAEAGEIDARTGEYSLQERLRKKEGIAIETRSPKGRFQPGVTDRDGNVIRFDGTASKMAREEVLRRKAELAPSVGASRKFLTEPPVAYREPVDTAPQGEEAYTPEERAEKAEQKRLAKIRQMQEMGGRN